MKKHITPVDALMLAYKLHDKQYDKGGQPYFLHIMRVIRYAKEVAAQYPHLYPDDTSVYIVAALHDTIEDCGMTIEKLSNSYSLFPREVEALTLLSRNLNPGLTYQEWIQKICDSGNLSAIIVKLADNMDNSDPERIAQLPPEEVSIVSRYYKSMEKLSHALKEFKLCGRISGT